MPLLVTKDAIANVLIVQDLLLFVDSARTVLQVPKLRSRYLPSLSEAWTTAGFADVGGLTVSIFLAKVGSAKSSLSVNGTFSWMGSSGSSQRSFVFIVLASTSTCVAATTAGSTMGLGELGAKYEASPSSTQ